MEWKTIATIAFIFMITVIPLRWCYSEHVKMYEKCNKIGGVIINERHGSVCVDKKMILTRQAQEE